jgi:hypothetical protein
MIDASPSPVRARARDNGYPFRPGRSFRLTAARRVRQHRDIADLESRRRLHTCTGSRSPPPPPRTPPEPSGGTHSRRRLTVRDPHRKRFTVVFPSVYVHFSYFAFPRARTRITIFDPRNDSSGGHLTVGELLSWVPRRLEKKTRTGPRCFVQ